jgi:hypothetical protein
MIAPLPKNAACLRQRCVHPPPVLCCINSFDIVQRYHLSDLTFRLLKATALPPGTVNLDESAMISRLDRSQLVSRSFQDGLCGICSYLGFDYDKKKQSLFVTTNLIHLRKFIPMKSGLFGALAIIRCRYDYSTQRLHTCLGPPDFHLLRLSTSLVCRSFRNLVISVTGERRVFGREHCMPFSLKFFARSDGTSNTFISNCNSPPGNSSGFMDTRCLTQPKHSNSICARRVMHESRTRLSLQSILKRYLNSCKIRYRSMVVARWINPPPRFLLNLRPFFYLNAIRMYQKLKFFPLVPCKIPWTGFSSMLQQALSTMCQTMIMHNSSRRYFPPDRLFLNFVPTH